jgi:glyoxylase-like metal-dependent hydrolase (beta-lactamase superfamily II)
MAMTYTGDVKPGGSPDTRELTHLTITKLAVDKKMSNNCYLLTCRSTGESVLIDAADDAPTLLRLCDATLEGVITTHQHWDHHRGLAAVVGETGATTYAGDPDADAITEQTGIAVDARLRDGDRIPVGDQVLEVIAIAGHTPGSVALLYDDPDGVPHLFTGDSLFPGGVGATFGDAEAFRTLIDEVTAKVFGRLPDDTLFYPGHGNDGRLGDERPHLAEWRERGW